MGNSVEIKKSLENNKRNPQNHEKEDTFTWSKDERKELKEELLISNLRIKLQQKYPDQKDFFSKSTIKLMQLGKNYQEHQEVLKMINTNIFLLFSPDGKLLSYLDNDGKTMFDISNFNFDNDFANLLAKKEGTYILKKDGKWYLYNSKNQKYHPEGSPLFNSFIFAFYLPTT